MNKANAQSYRSVMLTRICLLHCSILLLMIGLASSAPAQEQKETAPLETKVYRVEPEFILKAIGQVSTSALPWGGGIGDTTTPEAAHKAESARIVAFFEELGITFPSGTGVKFFQHVSKLAVSNTPANLAKLEKLLQELNVSAGNVTIELRIVKMPRATAKALFKEEGGINRAYEIKEATLKQISDLEDQKKAAVICQIQTTTAVGQSATVKSVREFIYPTRFREPQLNVATPPPEPPKGKPAGLIAPYMPTGFATREEGGLLTVTPNLGSDGKTINLSLIPERTFLRGILKWGDIPAIPNRMPVEQPEFVSRSVNTTITVKSGSTVLLAVYERYLEEEKDRDDIELMFLTATLSKH